MMEVTAVVAANALLGYDPDPPSTIEDGRVTAPGPPREFILGDFGRALFERGRKMLQGLGITHFGL